MTELQSGLSKAKCSDPGRTRRTVLYYGFLARVRCSHLLSLHNDQLLTLFHRGFWKDHTLVRDLPKVPLTQNSHCHYSSAIIDDIASPRDTKPDLVAYYYFDTTDATKRNLWGLLASLVIQLGVKSDPCCSALSQLYTNCGDGSRRPCTDALNRCLKRMLELEQRPIYILIDAVDHFPNTAGPQSSSRKEVLMFVEDIVRTRYPILYICLTSSPEQDIKKAHNLLTLRLVNLDGEAGQKEDIKSHIRSSVKDNQEPPWTKDDQERFTNALAKRADGK